MIDTYYSKDFRVFVTRGRYAVYAVLFVIIWLGQNTLTPAVALLLACVSVTPAVLQLASLCLTRKLSSIDHSAWSRRPMQGLFLLEWLWVLILLSLSQLSVVSAACIALMALACHTALWGWRWMISQALIGGIIGGGFILRDGMPAITSQVTWVDGISLFAVVGVMLMISAVAYQQAQQILQAGRLLKFRQQHLMRYLPKPLPEHLQQETRHCVQRVWLTVAFVDLVDFTQTTQRLVPDALVDVINEFLTITNTLVEQWGGWVSTFLGDGVLCVFASNHTHNHANSALQAVHCMRQLPGRLSHLKHYCADRQDGEIEPSHRLQVTSGIASGYCHIGDWGGLSRLDYTVIGVPVNLASRLQGAAKAHGGLLVDTQTASLVGTTTLQGVELELALKGFGKVKAFSDCLCPSMQD